MFNPKVGDRVSRVTPHFAGGQLRFGTIAKVEPYDCTVLVHWDGIDSAGWWYGSSNVDLVPKSALEQLAEEGL